MALGFTARTCSNYKITCQTSILNGFTDILDNNGNHFQPSTGVFTAPVRGLYTVGLQHDEGIGVPAQFDVVHESPRAPGDGDIAENVVGAARKDENVVGAAHTAENVVGAANTAADLIGGVNCFVKMVWLEEGDRLYVKLNMLFHGEFTLLAPSTFHCYLTG